METIGQQLRAARERKKITIEVAAEATKIKGERLRALEADQFEKIEAPIYVKGFIRIYAGFLGIDPKPLTEMYARSNRELSEPDGPPTAPPPPRPIARTPVGKTAPPPPSDDDEVVSPGVIVAVLGGVAALFIIIWGISGLIGWWQHYRVTAKAAAAQSTSASASAKVASVTLQDKTLSPAQTIDAVRAPAHYLTIRADQPCQVTVLVDGAVFFRGKMARTRDNKLEVRQFPGQRKFKVSASDGGALHVWYDTKDMGQLGRRGEKAEKEF